MYWHWRIRNLIDQTITCGVRLSMGNLCVELEESKESPSALELLRRILELEQRHTHITQEISKLVLGSNQPKPDHQGSSLTSLHQSHILPIDGPSAVSSSVWPVHGETNGGETDPFAMKLTETWYCNVVQSMGRAIHIWDCKHRIFFWNQAAENLYGYAPEEAYGRCPAELLTEPKDTSAADYLAARTLKGESWAGKFPVKSKSGARFVVFVTITPFLDENGRVVGAMCLSSDSRPYHVMKADLSAIAPTRIDFDSQQPQQTSLASKISNVALQVKVKRKTGADHDFAVSDDSDDTLQSESSALRINIDSFPSGFFFTEDTEEHVRGKWRGEEIDTKHGICNMLSSKVGKWMGKRRRSMWPWKGNKIEPKSLDFNQSHIRFADVDCQLYKNTILCSNEASGLWRSALSCNSTNGSSSEEMSIESNAVVQVQGEAFSMDYEILWEDLIIKHQIGRGSCGKVYQALWHGSDVAIKLFKHQEYYDNMIAKFKQEVTFITRLRHPNILLFMGAVTSRQHLCIVTEFLPRGCLFRILQRNSTELDWRQRLHMAVDIARGMNYLHCCNPPILHLNLKSSNLLVDNNWTVKVGDFGLSCTKHYARLNMKADKGTPQWMAPEILRNEQADEKSDVYSYGVVLWEIITTKIPWNDLNAMQVVAAVGFKNQRLEIPKDVDPLWASLIESCWCSDPQSRPTFQEILYKLEVLENKFTGEH